MINCHLIIFPHIVKEHEEAAILVVFIWHYNSQVGDFLFYKIIYNHF